MNFEIAGFEVLEFLISNYIDAVQECLYCSSSLTLNKKVKDLIPEEYLEKLEEDEEVDVKNTYNRIINIVEYVSGMTDNYAVSLYRKLKGIDIPM